LRQGVGFAIRDIDQSALERLDAVQPLGPGVEKIVLDAVMGLDRLDDPPRRLRNENLTGKAGRISSD